ncbi:MAG TPA: GNAT family N-acetyltransferase [Fimbriimonas sp.]|nr:GNAT family N-acetyltransferase [Fimbriimonas sp.]
MISSTPIFAAADILSTLEYYKSVLGFESTWTWGDPATFGSASGGGVTIMFNLQPEIAAKVKGHQHWIKVDDADALYEQHVSRGAKIVSEIEDKPWGSREYIAEDLNGYHLRIAGPPKSAAPKSSPLPDDVRLERRLPTDEEYVLVATEAFGREHTAVILPSTWSGVVALNSVGSAVGVLRIAQDAPSWFSIWDVAVLPEWQSKRIGSAMMKEAMAMIREAAPGSMVHLFTFKHGFYERLGFAKETVMMRSV